MKRNTDLIRKILLELERFDALPNGHYHFTEQNQLVVEGEVWENIFPHLELLYDAGYYKSDIAKPNWRRFRALTWGGHDFIDSVRDEKIWAETKEAANTAGSFTIEVLGALAKGFIKTKLEKHTGFELDV